MIASLWGLIADPGLAGELVSWEWHQRELPIWRTEKGGNKENWVTPGNRSMSSFCMVESWKGEKEGEKMGQRAMSSNFPKFYSFQKLQTRWCAGQWPIIWNNPFAPLVAFAQGVCHNHGKQTRMVRSRRPWDYITNMPGGKRPCQSSPLHLTELCSQSSQNKNDSKLCPGTHRLGSQYFQILYLY